MFVYTKLEFENLFKAKNNGPMNNFGFPTQFAQSQVTNTNFETNHTLVENGGLFSREECRNLARYFI
jgi:hypothetical protein